jgi:nitroreductase
VLAPSVHNTQPWRIVLRRTRMELWADRTRQLPALDPAGRALVQSVGAALVNARVALAAEGWAADVERFPRPSDPDLVAVLRPVVGRADPVLAALEPAVGGRHTNRRRFTTDLVPDDVLRRLAAQAAGEDTTLLPILDDAQRQLVAQLTREAGEHQTSSPDYREEVARWTDRSPSGGDGVPNTAVPRIDAAQPDELPLRDLDPQGRGALPWDPGSPTDQTLVLLATEGDDRTAWLRSGEALQRVLLDVTVLGWVASPLTQAIEVPATRTRLRAALTGTAHPQMLIRIGHADPVGPTPRRPGDEAVVNRWCPPEAPIPDQAGRAAASPDRARPRPVSDGRGGTTWV